MRLVDVPIMSTTRPTRPHDSLAESGAAGPGAADPGAAGPGAADGGAADPGAVDSGEPVVGAEPAIADGSGDLPEAAVPSGSARGRFAGAAALIAVLTIVSRLVGFGRTLVLGNVAGAHTDITNAYLTANTVPNIIFEIV